MQINRLVIRLATLLILLTGCTGSGPGPFDNAPPAQTPVLDQLSEHELTAYPKTPGTPFFSNQILKFHVPSFTLIDVAVDGYMLK